MKTYKIVLIEILIVSSFIGMALYSNINTTINYGSSNKENNIRMVDGESPQIADDFIPPPAIPNENFTWGFSNETELGFVYERYNDTEYSSGATYYNITSMPIIFANVTDENDTAYCVQLEQLYYDTTLNKNLPVPNTPLLNVSLVNFTADLSFMFPAFPGDGYMLPMPPPEDGGNGPSPGWFFMFVNPFIPKNGTELAFNWSAERLKLWYSMFLEGIDVEIFTDTGAEERNLYLKNSTTGAYANITYDEYGILIYGEVFTFDDEDGWMTYTLTTVYDLNPLDGIEWAVNEGDLLYYGINRNEIRINITRIVNISFYHPQYQSNIALQQVVANLSWWNDYSKKWEHRFEGVIGSANELNPLLMVNQSIPLLVPIGFDISDVFSFYQKMVGPNEEFDNAILDSYWITLENSTIQGFEKYLFNSSGFIDLIHMVGFDKLFEEDPGLLFRKNSTIIDDTKIWELDISPFGTDAFNITFNISVTAESHLLTSAFNINPTNLTGVIDNYGVLFIDIWLNDSDNLDLTHDAPINVSIEYDPAQYKNMKLWYFNVSSLDPNVAWTQIPYIDLGNGVIVFTVNYTSYFAFTNIPISILPSGDDDDDDDKETVVIPFGNYYLVFLAVAVISLVFYYKKRKI